MDIAPARKTRRQLQYGGGIPRKRFKVRESRCPLCLGSGTDSRRRLPGGVLWVQLCDQCKGAGVVELEIEA